MTRRILLITTLAAMAIAPMPEATARTLTPAQALQRAYHGSTTGLKPAKRQAASALTATPAFTVCAQGSETPAIYAFSGAAPTGGTLFVAADDATAVSVIGYTDAPIGNAASLDDLPDAVAAMLKNAAEQVSAAAAAGAYTSATSKVTSPYTLVFETPFSGSASVTPLLTTAWGQGDPFNSHLPQVGGAQPQAGSVAVAMAQVMKHWQYPAAGAGTVKAYKGGADAESVDLGTITFDWSNIIADYNAATDGTGASGTDGTITDTQKSAVADLVHACAAAVGSDYSATATTARPSAMVDALVNRFHYDPCMRLYRLDFISGDSIQKLIYANLQAGRPCIFAGTHVNASSSTADRQAFVLDGFDSATQCWHFNFGWNTTSYSTGFYYTLSTINPETHASPAVTPVRDFVTDRCVILDIKPRYNASGVADANDEATAAPQPLSAAVLPYKATTTYEFGAYSYDEEPLGFSITGNQLTITGYDMAEGPVFTSTPDNRTIQYGAMVDDKLGATIWLGAQNINNALSQLNLDNDGYYIDNADKQCDLSGLVSRVSEKKVDVLTYAIYLGQHTQGQTDYRRVKNKYGLPQCVIARVKSDGTITYSHPRDIKFDVSELPYKTIYDTDKREYKNVKDTDKDNDDQPMLWNGRKSAVSDSTFYILRFNAHSHYYEYNHADSPGPAAGGRNEEAGSNASDYEVDAVASNLSTNLSDELDIYSLVAVGVFEQDATDINKYTLIKSGPMVPISFDIDFMKTTNWYLRRYPNYRMPKVDVTNGRRYYILYNQDGTMLYGPVPANEAITTVIVSLPEDGGAADMSDAPVVYYNLQGIRMPDNALTPGIYIRRQGSRATKVIVR